MMKADMQDDHFGAGEDPIRRSGETDAGRDVDLAVTLTQVTVGTFKDQFDEERLRPDLSIMGMAEERKIDAVVSNLLQIHRFVVKENNGFGTV